jgi:hypothetical protein
VTIRYATLPFVGVRDILLKLLGVSAYQGVADSRIHAYPQLGDSNVDEIREALGGALQAPLTTRLRWYLADLEWAQAAADAGNMRPMAQLWRAMKRDGVIAGLCSTRAAGLVGLPNNFYGDPEIVESLTRKVGATGTVTADDGQPTDARARSVFDEMCPPAELSAMVADGFACGISVGELLEVKGRKYPVLVRLDPEYLVYRWADNRWYFQSVAGMIPITPGDGRWVLHVPGARVAPWIQGLWPALGRSFINKEHAMLHRSNFGRTVANPARLAYAPSAATEGQRIGFFKKLLAWSMNTVLELPPGYDAKLLETNGKGFEVFQAEIATSDNELMVAICGQVVTTTGGSGFISGDLFKNIRQDIIKSDGEALAYTVNTQILPNYVALTYGTSAITQRATIIEYDTSTPKELEAQARTVGAVADAMAKFVALLEGSNRELNVDEMFTRFNIPMRKIDNEPGKLVAPAAPEVKALGPARPAPGPKGLLGTNGSHHS